MRFGLHRDTRSHAIRRYAGGVVVEVEMMPARASSREIHERRMQHREPHRIALIDVERRRVERPRDDTEQSIVIADHRGRWPLTLPRVGASVPGKGRFAPSARTM